MNKKRKKPKMPMMNGICISTLFYPGGNMIIADDKKEKEKK